MIYEILTKKTTPFLLLIILLFTGRNVFAQQKELKSTTESGRISSLLSPLGEQRIKEKTKTSSRKLLIRAPKYLNFPRKKVKTKEQWSDVGSPKNRRNPQILLVDRRETSPGWSLTVRGDNFLYEEEVISFNNLWFLIFEFRARKGNMEGIEYRQKIHFTKEGEPYLLAKAKPGSGQGVYEVLFGLKLRIPANSVAGDYTSELELTIL